MCYKKVKIPHGSIRVDNPYSRMSSKISFYMKQFNMYNRTNMSFPHTFQFIQQTIRKDPANVDEILTPPDGQDEGVWKYEHLR